LGGIKTNDARCTREIKSRFVTAKAAFKKKKKKEKEEEEEETFHQQSGLTFEEETSTVLHREHSFV
jgi:hypothetical protein